MNNADPVISTLSIYYTIQHYSALYHNDILMETNIFMVFQVVGKIISHVIESNLEYVSVLPVNDPAIADVYKRYQKVLEFIFLS